MHRLRTFLTVIGAVTILALAANTVALAATGDSFLLGKSNKASKQTTLKRITDGPALKLSTKSSSDAPLTTNGKGKVDNLNADLLDGKDSTAFDDADLLDGKDSTAFAPMPTVIRGSWSMAGTAADATNHSASEGISFGWTLPSAPIAHLIPAAGPVPAGCLGTAAVPGASPGHLCVFIAGSVGTFSVAAVCGIDGCPGANRFGAVVSVVNNAAGLFSMSGTWAVGATSVTASP